MLDRYYDTFITLEDDYEFFIGMADYLKYADSIPSIKQVASQLPKLRIKAEDDLKRLQDAAVADLVVTCNELKKISKKNGAVSAIFEKEFEDFQSWLDGKFAGSMPLPASLFHILARVVHELQKLGYKDNVKKYIVFWDKQPEVIRDYVLSNKYSEYIKQKQIFDIGMKNELWGIFNQLALAFLIVTDSGTNYYDKLLKEAGPNGTSDMAKWWEAFNMLSVIGEWRDIYEQRKLEHKSFFNRKNFKMWARRIHNYLVEGVIVRVVQSEEPVKLASESSLKEVSTLVLGGNVALGTKDKFTFSMNTGDFTFNKIKDNLGRASREYQVLSCLIAAADHQADFSTLIKSIGLDGPTVSNKAVLSSIIKMIKYKLGILPKKPSSNPNIIHAVHKYGYRIIVN